MKFEEMGIEKNGCLEFTKAKANKNKKIFYHGKDVLRTLYKRYFETIPRGYKVSNNCNNPQCIKKEHLCLIPKASGRKFTREIVNNIRKEYIETKCSEVSLAKKYSVTRQHISLIVRNECWIDNNYIPRKL